MKRRKIIKLAALYTGAVLSAPLLSSLMSGCKMDTIDQIDSDYALQFFNPDEFKLIKTLVDLILPATDSPSGSEVGVHRMIDHMVGTVYKKDHREDYQKKFSSLVSYLNSGTNTSFMSLEEKEQLTMLQKLIETQDAILNEAKKALLDVRQQTIAYYLSTEHIGTKFLNYLPVPGQYSGCISLEEAGGKAWAL